MNAQAAVEIESAGAIPAEMGFGAEITVKREGGETTTLREVRLVRECPGQAYEDDSYRVEYMGITAGDIYLDRNADGTWGGEHESALVAGGRLAEWLMKDAVLSVEEID